MKYYIIQLIFLCSCINATAQWEAQFVQEQGTGLYDIHLIKGEQGIAVGRMGTIIKTNDGFRTWKRCEVKTRKDLFSLCFFDSVTAVAAGSDGIMLRTTDAGVSWNPQSSASVDTLYSIALLSSETAVAVGANGAIVKTTDKGLHWNKIEAGIPTTLRSIRFRNGIAITVGFGGVIIKSEDEGSSWYLMNSGTSKNLYTVSFVTDKILLTGGDSTTIYRSTDSGISWQFDNILYGVSDKYTPNIIHEIQFANDSIGYMCGYFTATGYLQTYKTFQRILYTKDAGKTWNILVGVNSDNPDDRFYDIYNNKAEYSYWHKIAIINPDSVIAVGNDQFDFSSKIIAGGPNSPLFQIRLNDTTTKALGFVSAFPKNIMSIYASSKNDWKLTTEEGELLTTGDGGSTWSSAQISSGKRCRDSEFLGGFGIFVCDSSRIYITKDNGLSWHAKIMDRTGSIPALASPYFYDVELTSPSIGFVKGNYGYREKISRTNNSGQTWEFVSIHTDSNVSYSAPYFTDEQHGWIFAQPHIVDSLNRRIAFKQGLLYYTPDGGNTWIDKTPYSTIKGGDRFTPQRIHFTDKLHGCFTAFDNDSSQSKSEGAYIFKTNDGGSTWNRTLIDVKPILGDNIVSFKLETVDMIGIDSLNYILYLGYEYSNQVVRSTDGGVSWILMTYDNTVPKYNGFRAFYRADATTMFMVGNNNMLYKWDISKNVSGVTEQLSDFAGVISIYPNPASSSITISGIEGCNSVRIMNSLGMEVASRQVINGKSVIDLVNLPSGIYFASIRTLTGVVIKPIVIQK